MNTTRYRRPFSRAPRLPPANRCDLCGRDLYLAERYHVKLVLRRGALKGQVLKTLHLCRNCLENLKRDKKLARKLKIKYYKMPTLGATPRTSL